MTEAVETLADHICCFRPQQVETKSYCSKIETAGMLAEHICCLQRQQVESDNYCSKIEAAGTQDSRLCGKMQPHSTDVCFPPADGVQTVTEETTEQGSFADNPLSVPCPAEAAFPAQDAPVFE